MLRHKSCCRLVGPAIFLFLAAAGLSCTSWQTATVRVSEPVCENALEFGVQGYSEREIARLLDDAVKENRVQDCWRPLMREALERDLAVPRRHLARAVHSFNQRGSARLFHSAVYRYLSAIGREEADYRPQDRALLEAYCSYLINRAAGADDTNLGRAELLCRRVDPDLYASLFR